MAILVVFYLVFLLFFFVFSSALIYHLWHFGIKGDRTRLFIVVYSIISFAIIFFTFLLLFIRGS